MSDNKGQSVPQEVKDLIKKKYPDNNKDDPWMYKYGALLQDCAEFGYLLSQRQPVQSLEVMSAEEWFIATYPNQSPADFAMFPTMGEYADYIAQFNQQVVDWDGLRMKLGATFFVQDKVKMSADELIDWFKENIK